MGRSLSVRRRNLIVLHWVSAWVIIWGTLSGFGVKLLPNGQPVRVFVEQLNPQVTTLFIPLFMWRTWIYLQSRPWQLHPDGVLQRGQGMLYLAFYLTINVVLLTGVLMMDHSIRLLGMLPMPQLVFDPDWLAVLSRMHRDFCVLLGGLMVLHLALVVLQQRAGRNVMGRMRLSVVRARIC